MANAESGPSSARVLTLSPGTAPHEITVGLHRVLQAKAGMRLEQKSASGAREIFEKLTSKQAELAIVNAMDIGLAFNGPERLKIGERNPYAKYANVRIVARGPSLSVGLFGRAQGPKDWQAIKGLKIAGEFSEQPALWYNAFGYLAWAGLGWSDMKVVSVKNAQEARIALIEGRVDVAAFALNTNLLKDANRLAGVRHLGSDCSDTGLKRLHLAVPGFTGASIKAGAAAGVDQDSCAMTYDMVFFATEETNTDIVKIIVKTINENIETLQKEGDVHKSWPKLQVTENFTAPYHSEAIAYLKKAGIWTEAHSQRQTFLLSLK